MPRRDVDFETPTINELSYRSDGKGGLNINLQPSTNNTYEIGSKTRIGNGILTAALFRTDTDNEIVVDENKDRRTTYKNAGENAPSGYGNCARPAVCRKLEAENGVDLSRCDLPYQRL